ncbi:hypothetical protein [Staphylococcus intermedius]|uniref:Uncharacterized protein n=1 Tax=Staphylococcus intermedius NCTC 11048 TaxID=1141106 RepID=A0A380G2K5_STAIN|nr:hypothetical protein [Staphylococcus intermedius]PCF64272.1 hypothetical protein B5C04_09895 [Staphylococcus intermedius]PCF78988.1 hypothetical protein B4W74_10245 [Staphylococcus intermedius]PCF79960.1 hypothetical protein B4W70_09885 [Staphylococcus intermedius]PCF86258.1 hypothetical protein B4W76_08410 [Staphylococcus intermedius]PCF89380.1 hypothetical protein B4W75_00660 [Staphylococcus intermedius]
MTRKKVTLIAIAVLLATMVIYISMSLINLNQKEAYYGQVSHKNDSIALYSENDKHIAYLKKDLEQMKAGDWVKVTMSDQKGVILNVEPIAVNEVPKKILAMIEN